MSHPVVPASYATVSWCFLNSLLSRFSKTNRSSSRIPNALSSATPVSCRMGPPEPSFRRSGSLACCPTVGVEPRCRWLNSTAQFLNPQIDLALYNTNLLMSRVSYSLLLGSFWCFVVILTMLGEAWHPTFDQLHSLRPASRYSRLQPDVRDLIHRHCPAWLSGWR